MRANGRSFLKEINMGMDLLGNHGDERFSMRGWRECLERAIEFGWTPELLPQISPVSGRGLLQQRLSGGD